MFDKFLSYYQDYLASKEKLAPYHIERIYCKDSYYKWHDDEKRFVSENCKNMSWFSDNINELTFIAESKTNILLIFMNNKRINDTMLYQYSSNIKQEIMSVVYIKNDREIFKTINVYVVLDNPDNNLHEINKFLVNSKYTEGKFFISIFRQWNESEFKKIREIHSSKENIPYTHFMLEDLVKKLKQEIESQEDLLKLDIVSQLEDNADVLDERTMKKWLFSINEISHITKQSITSNTLQKLVDSQYIKTKNKWLKRENLKLEEEKELIDAWCEYVIGLTREGRKCQN